MHKIYIKFAFHALVECRGRAVLCIGLEFWRCQNVGSNPSLAGRGACVLEQRHLTIIASSFGWDVKLYRSRVLCNARKRTQDTYHEREGAFPGVSGFVPWAPSRVDMCVLQIFCIIINLGRLYMHMKNKILNVSKFLKFIYPFMNGNNGLKLGLDHRLMTCFVHIHGPWGPYLRLGPHII